MVRVKEFAHLEIIGHSVDCNRKNNCKYFGKEHCLEVETLTSNYSSLPGCPAADESAKRAGFLPSALGLYRIEIKPSALIRK